MDTIKYQRRPEIARQYRAAITCDKLIRTLAAREYYEERRWRKLLNLVNSPNPAPETIRRFEEKYVDAVEKLNATTFDDADDFNDYVYDLVDLMRLTREEVDDELYEDTPDNRDWRDWCDAIETRYDTAFENLDMSLERALEFGRAWHELYKHIVGRPIE